MSTLASTSISSSRHQSSTTWIYNTAAGVVVVMAVFFVAWASGPSLTTTPAATVVLTPGATPAVSTTNAAAEESRRAFEQQLAATQEQQRLAAAQEQEHQAQLLELRRIAAEQEAIRQAKEAKRRAAFARIEGLESEMSLLRHDITATENQRADHQTRVNDYMMDHKMAIAALAAGVAGAGVALDGKNEFSDDAKNLGGATAVIAGLWALANYEEVIEVADRMAKASAMQTDYKNRIDRMKLRVVNLNSQIAQEKRNLD